MVHFPGFARTRLYIQRAVYWFYQYGFPHSDIPGSKPVCGFPRLIAAYHVLHRLLAPRHPPYALSSLTIKLTQNVAKPASLRLRRIGIRDARALRAWISSPFHIALLEQICQLRLPLRGQSIGARSRKHKLPASFSCQRAAFRQMLETSLRLAERESGLEPKPRAIKNPASSAG